MLCYRNERKKAGHRSLSPSPGLCHLRADRHYSAVLKKPHRSALRGSVLPVDLRKASERALPAGAVPLALESALLGAEVPHCPVGTAHQDLQRGVQNSEESRVSRSDPPDQCRPAVSHLCLTASAPAQGAHRFLASWLSRRREIRRLFALKVHPYRTRASVSPGSRAGDLPTSRRPVLPPTFQDPSLRADPHMVPACRHSRHNEAWQPTAAFPAQVCVTGARRVGSGPALILGVSRTGRVEIACFWR